MSQGSSIWTQSSYLVMETGIIFVTVKKWENDSRILKTRESNDKLPWNKILHKNKITIVLLVHG